MEWQKLGMIWTPAGEADWAQTHATLPIAQTIADDRWRVFLSCRDAHGKSRIGRVTLDVSPLPKGKPRVVRFDPAPVLSLGAPGTFDDCGVMPSWLAEQEGELRMYYIGWNVRGLVPYHVSVGLAISGDGGETFQRAAQGPVLDRCLQEPYFATTPCVMRAAGNWRMWYASGHGWREIDGKWEPAYHVNYAESPDGVAWTPAVATCIDAGPEFAVCRPTVFQQNGGYGMLYSYRYLTQYRTDPALAYRLGYAHSADGVSWRRSDESVGIERSGEGWDAEMIEYSSLHEHRGETYLLYNGNGFGRSGFGIARLLHRD
jgi:hypothetical protein